MDMSTLLTGGGIASLILAAVYAGRLVLDWIETRKQRPVHRNTVAVSDAATANATLVQTLDGLQKENVRLQKRVAYLEGENRTKEDKIVELQQRVQKIADELKQLREAHTA